MKSYVEKAICFFNVFGVNYRYTGLWYKDGIQEDNSYVFYVAGAILLISYLEVVICSKVDWNESQPYNASTIHSECYVLSFVEVLGNFSRLEGIYST